MGRKRKHNGFSLMEMLLSIGVLSVGMMFIAGVFPVAIYFSTVSTERTIAAVVADEAFAKIRIYANEVGIDIVPNDPNDDVLKNFIDILNDSISPDEFAYPSAIIDTAKQYYWSALCSWVEGDANSPVVQVTVFVSRKVAPHLKYHTEDGNGLDRPVPVKVGVSQTSSNELEIDDDNEKNFINDGYTIVDDETGWIYRVLKRYPGDNDTIILLDRDWDGDSSGNVWVVPPPENGSRGPCIAVYQRVIQF